MRQAKAPAGETHSTIHCEHVTAREESEARSQKAAQVETLILEDVW